MKKKKQSYKKIKGVRYIAQSLTKYYKKDYPSYGTSLPKAKEILSELKKQGKSVVLSNIFPFVKKAKPVKSQKPDLDSNLTQVKWYFELEDYPIYIARCPNTIWFTSKLTPKGLPDIQGGSTPSYFMYFAPYVDYINSMAGLTDKEDRRYETDWLVTCTEPKYNPSKKRWESEIISVDDKGNRIDYGFNPSKPKERPEDLIVSKETPVEPKKVPEKEEIKREPEEIGQGKEESVKKKAELDEEIKKLQEERLLKEAETKRLEQEQKTLKEKVQAVKELKELGMSMEDIKKYLGI
jgi:hypothetical protein